jgi:hypothetical protein
LLEKVNFELLSAKLIIVKQIPESFDPKILKEENLIMICINANQVNFHFDSQLSISVEYEISIEKDSQHQQFSVFYMKSDYGLLDLLENKIVDAYTDVERRDLRLKFANNTIITSIGHEFYESYSLSRNQDVILEV